MAPDALHAAQRALYDAITSGPRASGPRLFPLMGPDGALEGPFNAFLLAPRVGGALAALGEAVRYGTALGARARELAILAVAWHHRSEFEWWAHEAVARHAGVGDAELDAIRGGAFDVLSDPLERCTAATAAALAADGDLDDAAYGAAVATLGEAGVFEVSTLVGYYGALALQLRLFRVAVPPPDTP